VRGSRGPPEAAQPGEREAALAVKHQQAFSLRWQWMSTEAVRRGWLLCNLVPKHHWLLHLIAAAHMLNCRYTRNYSDESAIGVLAKAAKRIMSAGRWQETLQPTLLAKYLISLEIRGRGFGA